MELNWLHLSDIHYGYTNYDTNRMRSRLLKYLGELTIKFNFIVITGDITYKGMDYGEEIKIFLNDLLRVTGLIDFAHIFIVPGNHDIKRETVRERIINDVINNPNPPNEINELDSASYQILLNGQKKFCDFYKDLTGREYNIEDNLHFVIKNKKYNIIHINTCIVSLKSDEGKKLLVRTAKLSDALTEVDNSKVLNIAIGHHALDCLHIQEEKKVENLFSDYNVDLYLSGHFHRPTFNFQRNNINDINYFVCGSGMVDGYGFPSVLTGRINIDDGNGDITFHRWNNDEEFWHVHSGISRKAPQGILPFTVKRISNQGVREDLRIEEDDFKKFIIDFHKKIIVSGESDYNYVPKDINDKFENMQCNPTFIKQFDSYSKYFYIVDSLFSSSSYLELNNKFSIPNVIISYYQEVVDSCDTGMKIVEQVVNRIYDEYKHIVQLPISLFKVYIKILTFWTIEECDIFNERKD